MLLLGAICLLVNAGAIGDEALPSAESLLTRSIAFHDPDDAWSLSPITITARVQLSERLAGERGYETRTDRIYLDNRSDLFRYESAKGDVEMELVQSDDERMTLWRHYFTYMFGIPMKLRDPGTQLDPVVKRVEFEGREVFALRVTYAADVGSDVWDFFMDTETSALVGCRFFHDEAKQDGEFIAFDGMIEGPYGLRLPKDRRWHMNTDGEFIALDEIVSVE